MQAGTSDCAASLVLAVNVVPLSRATPVFVSLVHFGCGTGMGSCGQVDFSFGACLGEWTVCAELFVSPVKRVAPFVCIDFVFFGWWYCWMCS